MQSRLPPEPALFAHPAVVVAEALAELRVPERLTISEAALRHRVLDNPGGGYSGPWTFDRAPYVRRPMDCLQVDSGYSMVAVMGPGQCAKSEIGNNWMLHTVVCDPADMIFVGPDKQILGSYMVSQVNKMIRLAAAMKVRQLHAAGADNIFQKQFKGCTFYAAWPVKSQLRARPLPRFRVDDYDAIPENIEGEGNVLVLLAGRQTTFEGFTMGYVNSSPALGVERGIEKLVASGTDERWHVDCLHCRKAFALEFERLDFKRDGTPEEAKATAVVVCPSCGGIHEQKDKTPLMASGRWVGAGQTIDESGAMVGARRQTEIASFRFDGLMGFASWGRLALIYRSAELTFELTQDEDDLRAAENAHNGRNYKSRIAGAEPIEPSELEARCLESEYEIGTVPDWCLCLTAAVDVQGNRFEVEVVGWGPEWQSARVDRFPILALDDGETRINPGRTPEHWDCLIDRVIWRRYPVAGMPEMSLPVMVTAIDTGGLEGVTDNAFAFWNRAMKKGVPATGITLIKGGNNPKARLLPPPHPDAKRKGAKGAPDPELFVPNVNRIKTIIDTRLRRQEMGSGYMAMPQGFALEYIEELTAEAKVDGLWTRKPGRANESLDLEVYNYTNMIRLGGSDGSLAWVPLWARPQRTTAIATAAGPRGRRSRLNVKTYDAR